MERQNVLTYLLILFILCFTSIEAGGLFGFYTQTITYLKEPKYSLVGICHDNIITFVGGFTSSFETTFSSIFIYSFRTSSSSSIDMFTVNGATWTPLATNQQLSIARGALAGVCH